MRLFYVQKAYIGIKKRKYMSSSILNQFKENYSILTIHGTREIYIENFVSIIILTECNARIRAVNEIIEIEGDKLSVEYLNHDDIKIIGNIKSIKLTGVGI